MVLSISLKTKLDEQLKEIRKCYHQKYLNTKPIINNINKINCWEQNCELIIEKNNDNIETCIEYKIDSKVARNEEIESVGKTNSWSVGKTNSREKPPPGKSTNFHEIQINFHNSENNYSEENKLIAKDTNIKSNNSEDNCLRINGSNIENGNNESTVKSN